MKYLISIVIWFLFAVSLSAENVRVITKPDGGIAIIRAVGKGNDTTAYFKKEQAKTIYKGCPYRDIDIRKIPKDRSKRNQWAWSGSSVTIRSVK